MNTEAPNYRPSLIEVKPGASGVRLSWSQCGEDQHLDGPDLETVLPFFARMTHLIRERVAAGLPLPDERDLIADMVADRDRLRSKLQPN